MTGSTTASTATGSAGQEGRLESVDGLRAVAALAVFFFHLTWRSRTLADSPLGSLTGHLDLGVEVFFVLSGFLIFGPFATALTRGRRLPAPLSYAARRAGRVWPGYLVALVASLWLGLTAVEGTSGFLKHASLTYTYFDDREGRGLAVAWTLVVEVSFYLFVPLVARALLVARRRAVEASVCLILAGAWFQHLVAYSRDTGNAVRVLPPALLTLGVGMLFASVRSHGDEGGGPIADGVRWLARRPLVPLAAAAVAFGLVLLFVDAGPDLHQRPGQRFGNELGQAVVAAGLALPVLLGSGPRRWLRFLSHPLVAYGGTISYGFYLWHVPVLAWLRPLLVDGSALVAVAGWVVGLGVTAAAAVLSWHLVEQPVIGAVGRLTRGRDRAPAERSG